MGGEQGARKRHGRVVFAALWIALQGALVMTAGLRADGAFGFRMFSESSTVHVSLFREVGSQRRRVHVDGGVWRARDERGMVRRFSWYDRVKAPRLGVFDREISASYGARAQLERYRAALDDVADHLAHDAETRRLILVITIRRNGREPRAHELARAVAGGA